jgi:transposase-like protein
MSRRGPRFNEEQKLAIVKEGEKTGVETVCAKYGISDQSYRNWRHRAYGTQPKKYRSSEEKLRILEEGFHNGISRTCAAHRIDPTLYYYWKKQFGYSKSPPRPVPLRLSAAPRAVGFSILAPLPFGFVLLASPCRRRKRFTQPESSNAKRQR